MNGFFTLNSRHLMAFKEETPIFETCDEVFDVPANSLRKGVCILK